MYDKSGHKHEHVDVIDKVSLFMFDQAILVWKTPTRTFSCDQQFSS